jgi:hypothetical protein
MTTEKAIRIMAGLFVLLSLGLGVEGSPIFVSRNWLWFTAFVGANLLQSAITGFCPAEMVFKKLGMRQAGQA